MRVSIIIPTVNRPRELERLLASFEAQTVQAHEIIIVDQGDGVEAVLLAHPRLPVRHIRVSPASLTRARNAGIAAAAGDVVGFLDDDCLVAPDYVEKIAAFFTARPEAKGVQGVITNFEEGHRQKVGGSPMVYRVYAIFARFFLLNAGGKTNTLLLSGRNRYASCVDSVQTCEWMSGIGNYRKDVFTEFKFDEALTGYALGEDKLFSYPIGQKYPGSLYIDPTIRCRHDYGETGRPMGKEAVAMKIGYTRYVWEKLMRSRGLLAVLSYWWANLGDLIAVFLSVLMRKNSFSFFWWHVIYYWKAL